jgi:hypothetical protein
MNQIDPGPGYRIFYRDEPLQDGIQYWSEHKQCWLPRPEPSWVLSPTDTYRIAVNLSQRYRITGTGGWLDGYIVEVVEWGKDHCLVGFPGAQTWIDRRCLQAITDYLADAEKKVEPVVGYYDDTDEKWIDEPSPFDRKQNGRIEPKPVVKQSLTTEYEYIEPTAEHVGQMVEVKDIFDTREWKARKLVAVLPSKYRRKFVAQCEAADDECALWQQARIKQQPKPEPKYRDVMPSDSVSLAMQMAAKSFGGDDGVFNAAGFSNAMRRLSGVNCSLDGYVVAAILRGRIDVEAREGGATYRYLNYIAPKPEPRYRDVTSSDIGKAIQVRDHDDYDWIDCSLLRIVWMMTHDAKGTQDHKTYVCDLGQTWAQARILDGGEA